VVVSVVAVLCVLGLLVAADFGFRAAAQARVAALLDQKLGTTGHPDVDIHGFPFLTQALTGDYSNVHLEASGVHPPGAPLRNLHFVADLHDVHVGLASLLTGGVDEVRIGTIDGQVRVGPTDIARAVETSELGRRLHPTDIAVEPASAADVLGVPTAPARWRAGRVSGMRLSAALDIAGLKTRFTALTAVALDGSGVTITTKQVHIANGLVSASVPPFLLDALQSVFDVHLDSGSLPLPFAVTPTAVFARAGSLILRGTAHDVTFRFGNASGTPSQLLDPVSVPDGPAYPGGYASDADQAARDRLPARPVQPLFFCALRPQAPLPRAPDARADAPLPRSTGTFAENLLRNESEKPYHES
jgi:hypothetical protein